MKKLLLACTMMAVLVFPSCSSDDDSNNNNNNSVVTARIDGVEYNYNTINVDTETYTDGGQTYTDVIVTASIDNNPNNRISFIAEQGVLGLDASWYFSYFLNDTAHPKTENFQVNVTQSTNNRLVGTFAGDVQADVEPFDIIEITNGTFDITY